MGSHTAVWQSYDPVSDNFGVGNLLVTVHWENVFIDTHVQTLQAAIHQYGNLAILKHLHNVGTQFHCPQTFLNLHFQYWDDISDTK